MLTPQARRPGLEPVPDELLDHGACVAPEVDPEWFSPEATPRMVARAQRICADCPVQTRCLQWATEHDEWGCWGGVMFRNKYDKGRTDPQLREAAHRLFDAGYHHNQVSELLDISLHTAIGYRAGWQRQHEHSD